MRLAPFAAVSFAMLASLAEWAGQAHAAAALSFTATVPKRQPLEGRGFDGASAGAVLTRADCEADYGVVFNLLANTVTTISNIEYVQVWARKDTNVGSSCAPESERLGIAGSGDTSSCRLVIQFSRAQITDAKDLVIPVRNIVMAAYQQLNTSDSALATSYTTKAVPVDVCKPKGAMAVPITPPPTPNLQLSFLALDGVGNVIGGSDSDAGTGTETIWKAVYDLAGPDAPTELGISAGNQQLYTTFTGTTADTSVGGYTVYCVKTTRKWTATPKGVDAAFDVDEVATDSAPDTDPGDTGDTGDAAADASDTGATVDAGSSSSCGDTTGILEVGAFPTPALTPYVCGSTGQTSGSSKIEVTATNGEALVNDTYYAVAIAGRDVHGNTGPLSAILCAAPGETIDFWQRYRDAGGQAGGGYCSYGGAPLGAFAVAGMLALLTLVGRRAGRRP